MKRQQTQGIATMQQPTSRRLAIAILAILTANGLALAPAAASDPTNAMRAVPSGTATMSRAVKLGLDKSLVIDLPRDARDILVSNPDIADAVIRTPTRIYVTGVKVGQSNVIVFDRAGQQIVSLQLDVERDTTALAGTLRRLIPDSDISVEVISDNVVLSGTVKNASDSEKAQDIARIFVNGGANDQPSSSGGGGTAGGVTISTAAPSATPTSAVVNMLTIQGEDQVQVKINVAEVQRSLVKQLGIDWNAQNINIAGLLLSAATALPFAVTGATPPNSAGVTIPQNYAPVNGVSQGTLNLTIKALEQTNLFKTLAEPTLTAISGESASFLAGGEFPVPTGRDQSGNVSIDFKPFGVALSMTPVVLSDGRINLHVKTEVSELSSDGAVSLGGISIPSLKVRRAETTLELPSGGSMVLGGLLEDSVRQSISQLPGIGKLPILGPLFRSRDFQRAETELVIIVTPYLVKPVPRTALATPDQGYATPSDSQSLLFGTLNRKYRGQSIEPADGQKYQGQVGYIYR
jgi:pilus assembly protein CpaC